MAREYNYYRYILIGGPYRNLLFRGDKKLICDEACRLGYLDIVQRLPVVTSNGIVNMAKHGYAINEVHLPLVIRYGHLDAVRKISDLTHIHLRHGISNRYMVKYIFPRIAYHRQRHPDVISMLCRYGYTRCVKMVLDLCPDPTIYGEAIQHAACAGRSTLIKYLIDRGVPVTERSFELACAYNAVNVVKQLLQPEYLSLGLMAAIEYSNFQSIEVLLGAGVELTLDHLRHSFWRKRVYNFLIDWIIKHWSAEQISKLSEALNL